MDYGIQFQGKVYTPSGTAVSVEDVDARNRAIEQAELAHWQTQPDQMLAYFQFPAEKGGGLYRPTFYPDRTGAYVETGPGTKIGDIIEARVYRHNFGQRFISIRVQGTNGATYYGRASYDWGTCVRLRKAKR